MNTRALWCLFGHIHLFVKFKHKLQNKKEKKKEEEMCPQQQSMSLTRLFHLYLKVPTLNFYSIQRSQLPYTCSNTLKLQPSKWAHTVSLFFSLTWRFFYTLSWIKLCMWSFHLNQRSDDTIIRPCNKSLWGRLSLVLVPSVTKHWGWPPRRHSTPRPTCTLATHVNNIQPVNHIAQLHHIIKIAKVKRGE